MKYFMMNDDFCAMTSELTLEELGRLIRAINAYLKGEEYELIGSERFLFPVFKVQIDRENEAQNAVSSARAEAGRKSAEAKKRRNEAKAASVESDEQTSTNSTNINNAQQNQQMLNLLEQEQQIQQTSTKSTLVEKEKESERESEKEKEKERSKEREREKEREKEKERESFICSEPLARSEPAIMKMPLIGGKTYSIYESDVKKWTELYPAVDIMQDLRSMFGWLDSNPSRRKTERGMKAFITSWLSRTQNKGGNRVRGKVVGIHNPIETDAWSGW